MKTAAILAFLALGDSYTIGEGVTASERWPALLARALQIPDPQIIARTGWTTDELAAAIEQTKPQNRFDLVTLMIGVNDQYRVRTAEEYRLQFAALLVRAIQFARYRPSHVIVVSIPDWSVTPFAAGRDRNRIATEIDRFNAVNREEAARAGAKYADITAISRRTASDPSLVAGDGLHPSARMYSEWLGVILPIARDALRQ